KKPQQHTSHHMRVDAATEEFKRLMIDSTGPFLQDSPDFLYRLVFDDVQQDQNINLNAIARQAKSFHVTWKHDQDNIVNLGYEQLNSSHVRDQHAVIILPDPQTGLQLWTADIPVRQQGSGFEAEF